MSLPDNIKNWLERVGLKPEGLKAEPLYSPAIALRMRGRYQEALNRLEQELARFPGDFQGLMLKAEIQATNLDDLPGAAATVHHICQLPKATPGLIAGALSALADWQLQRAKDPVAAAETLQLILQRLPDTPQALQACQRLAHLTSADQIQAGIERPAIKLKSAPRNMGLQPWTPPPDAKNKTPVERAEALTAHLEQHPLDLAAREELAMLLARELNAFELAVDQMEQLISCPNTSPQQVAHWLNLLAEMHVHLASDMIGARQALERIIECFPGSAHASQAQARIQTLANELPKDAPHALKIGQYEQRLGLKNYQPPRPIRKPRLDP